MASKSLQQKIFLLVVDALLITGALLLAILLVARPGYLHELVYDRTTFFVLPVILNLLAVYFVQGYHVEEIVTPWKGLAAMTLAAVFGGLLTAFLFFIVPSAPEFSAKVLLLAAGLMITLLWLVRLVYGRLLSSASLKENLLIIGTGESAILLAKILNTRKRSPYRVLALLKNPLSDEPGGEKPEAPVIQLADLPGLLREQHVDTIVLGQRGKTEDRLIRVVVELKRRGTKVTELTELYEEVTGMTPVKYVGEFKMLFQNFGQRNEFLRYGDALLNQAGAALALLLTSPIWPIIVLGQQLASRGPVFVESSERVGLGGKSFFLYKFRSMVPNATQKGQGLVTGTHDPRIFPFGRFLRKTHLDELPQLLNILKGDMNFIGPRAEYRQNVRDLEKKIPFYHERHMIKPGLTGWAQVRNVYTDASEQGTLEKIQYDLYYLKNKSVALDLAIILRTIKLILRGKGTS